MTAHAPIDRPFPLSPEPGSPGASGPTVVVADAFLSPRVVDRRLFTELSAELRRLAEEAQAQRTALTQALEQSARVAQDLSRREQIQQSNLELGARAIKRIEERATQVQAILDRATDAGRIVDQVESRASSIIESKVMLLEAKIEAVQSAANAKAEALEERLRLATREFEQRIEALRNDAESVVAPGAQRLTTLIEQAKQMSSKAPGCLGDLVSKGETARAETEAAIRRFDQAQARFAEQESALSAWAAHADQRLDGLNRRREEIEQAVSELASAGEEASGALRQRLSSERANMGQRLDEVTDELRARVARVLAELESDQTGAEARASKAVSEASEAVATLESRAELAARAAREAMTTLGPEAQGVITELKALVRQGQDAHNTTSLALRLLDKSSERAGTLLAKLEPWQGLVDSGASVPEPIRRLIDTVRAELGTDLSHIAAALRLAATRAEKAVGAVDQAAHTTATTAHATTAGAHPAATPGALRLITPVPTRQPSAAD